MVAQGGIHYSRYIFSEKNPNLTSGELIPAEQGGYHIGLAPSLRLASGKAELALPLQYVLRTFARGPVIADTNYSRDRFHTLELNPRVGYYLLPRLMLHTGIYASFIIQAHYDAAGDDNWSKIPKFVAKALYNDIDAGLTAGVRYSIHRFHIHSTIQYGLSPITRNHFTDVNGEPLDTKARNLAFQLGMGYSLIAGK